MKNKLLYIIAALAVILLLISIEIRHQTDLQHIGELSQQNEALTAQNQALQQDIATLQDTVDKQTQEILQLTNEITQAQQTKVPEAQKTNRGEINGKRRMMEVTAYDLSYQSCQKHPDHPLYGITASGVYVEEWNTIAAGKELPFGTKVYIPYFKDKPNGGIFTVHDRGGGVKNGRIDVYMESYAECMEFGRRQLEVWVME